MARRCLAQQLTSDPKQHYNSTITSVSFVGVRGTSSHVMWEGRTTDTGTRSVGGFILYSPCMVPTQRLCEALCVLKDIRNETLPRLRAHISGPIRVFTAPHITIVSISKQSLSCMTQEPGPHASRPLDMTRYMAVQYELGIGRTREGQPAHEATRARLALYRHRCSPRGVAQRRVISSLSAPASPPQQDQFRSSVMLPARRLGRSCPWTRRHPQRVRRPTQSRRATCWCCPLPERLSSLTPTSVAFLAFLGGAARRE